MYWVSSMKVCMELGASMVASMVTISISSNGTQNIAVSYIRGQVILSFVYFVYYTVSYVFLRFFNLIDIYWVVNVTCVCVFSNLQSKRSPILIHSSLSITNYLPSYN